MGIEVSLLFLKKKKKFVIYYWEKLKDNLKWKIYYVDKWED